MKKIAKKALTALLSAALLLSMTSWAAAADYEDMPSGWSKEAMEAAVENGLLQGDDLGNLNPKGLLTRAQMAAVITRAFGAAKQADLSAYTDMDSDKWYYEAVSKAAHMGVMAGDGQSMNPESNITRQEAFAILARALKLTNGDSAALEKFSDADQVANWAVGDVAAMVSAGYVNGNNGRLNPVGSITREEFAQVMFNIFGTYCAQAGTYTETPVRSVMVNVPDVTLKNITVPGDIIIGDGVGDGDVILDHVNVEGRLVVRGGGVNSVHIVGGEQAWQVVIAKVDGNVRVVADEGTQIEAITVEDGSDDIIIEGQVGTVSVETEGVTVKLNNAKVDKLHVIAPEVSVTMTGKTEVTFLTVFEAAKGSTVTGEKDTTISNVIADTNVTVAGGVKVEKIEGSGAVTDESGKEVKPSQPTGGGGGSYTPPPHSHTWVDGAILTPATCAAEGSMEQTCSGCGETRIAVITKLLHTEEEIPAVEPTCTAGGLTAGKRCTVCQMVTQAQKPVDTLGHDWGEGEVTTEATCAATGTKRFTCSRCQGTRTETIPTIEHTWVAGEPVENGTCGGSTTTSTCSVCGATKTESTGEATHTPAEAVRENEIPATCAAGGSYDEVVKCSACHAELSREHKTTEKTTNHTEVIDSAVEPTCTGTGKTEGKHCSVCGEVLVAQTIRPAAGHTFDEAWSSDGTNHWHAATCGHTDKTKDKAAHNWNAGEVTTTPTCETAGVKTLTCTVCAATKDEPIEKLGHDWEEISKVEATCTEAGREAGKRCKREGCNATEGLTEITALGHNFSTAWTSDGAKHWHTCSRCDVKDAEAAHTPGEWVVTKEPTATEEGTKVKKCTVCQTVVATESIPATGDEPEPGPEEDISTGEKPVSNVRFEKDSQSNRLSLVWDAPTDSSNINYYRLTFKIDGTWRNQSASPSEYGLQHNISSSRLGTYTRVRIESLNVPDGGNPFENAEVLGTYETDISLTVSEQTTETPAVITYVDTNETNWFDTFDYSYVITGLEANKTYWLSQSIAGEDGTRGSSFTTDNTGRATPHADQTEQPITDWSVYQIAIYEEIIEIGNDTKTAALTSRYAAKDASITGPAESVSPVTNVTLAQPNPGYQSQIQINWAVPEDNRIDQYCILISSDDGATWQRAIGSGSYIPKGDATYDINTGNLAPGTYKVKVASLPSLNDHIYNNGYATSDWTFTIVDSQDLSENVDCSKRTVGDYWFGFNNLTAVNRAEEYVVVVSLQNILSIDARSAVQSTNSGNAEGIIPGDLPIDITVANFTDENFQKIVNGSGYYLIRKVNSGTIDETQKSISISYSSWSNWKALTFTGDATTDTE